MICQQCFSHNGMALKEEFEYVGKSLSEHIMELRILKMRVWCFLTWGSSYFDTRVMFYVTAFRCAYCYFMNPARKTRPQAPRLPEFSFERRLRSESPETQSSAATETPEDSDAPEGISYCWQPVTSLWWPHKFIVILSCHLSIKTATGKPPRRANNFESQDMQIWRNHLHLSFVC